MSLFQQPESGDLRPDQAPIQLSNFPLPDGRWLLYSSCHPNRRDRL